MITKVLKDANYKFAEIKKEAISNVYKEVTGLDINDFYKGVLADVELRKEKAEAEFVPFDIGYESPVYINEKTEDAYNVAIAAFEKQNNISITFDETYDAEGKSILVFSVNQTIRRYIVNIDLECNWSVWEMITEDVGENISSENPNIKTLSDMDSERIESL